MWIRRAFFRWLLPAAILLPVWIVVGWALFSGSGWGFLGTVFLAAPAVLAAELIVALLIRARPTVRSSRAVSWWDALGVTVWHGLVVAFGFFLQPSAPLVLVCAIVAFLALVWSSLGQLWREARGSFARMWPGTGPGDLPYDQTIADRARQHAEVIVVNEVGRPGDGRGGH